MPRKIFMFKKTNTTDMRTDLSKLSDNIIEKLLTLLILLKVSGTISRLVWPKACTNTFLPRLLPTGVHLPGSLIRSRVLTNVNKGLTTTIESQTRDPVNEAKFKDLCKEISRETRKTRRLYVRRTCEASSTVSGDLLRAWNRIHFGICTLKARDLRTKVSWSPTTC